MLVAMVLARKGQADSAKAVARAARGSADVDATRDLMLDDARVQVLAGNKDEALKSLRGLFGREPRPAGRFGRRSRLVVPRPENDPGFKQLVGAQ